MAVCPTSHQFAQTTIAVTIILMFAVFVYLYMQLIAMPGHSYSGALPPLSEEESALAPALEKHVNVLAGEIGPRSLDAEDGLRAAERYVVEQLKRFGLEAVKESFHVGPSEVSNYFVELPGAAQELFIIGAHYDTVGNNTPGANDNGSGVAAALELAKRFKDKPAPQKVRISFFVNEEPPYFVSERMGSFVQAKRLKDSGRKVLGMLSLETIGFYSDAPGSQRYPPPFSAIYPNQGNFIGFVGDTASADLVRGLIGAFRETTKFPAEGIAAPRAVPGVGWSDHWSFWEHGFQAVMLTDTAPFRYPHYHAITDTPDKIDYAKMARVVLGVERAVRSYLTRPSAS